VQHGRERHRQSFVSRRNAAVVLDLLKESLHTIPFFIEDLIIFSLDEAIGFRRHDRFTASRLDYREYPIGIITLVGDHYISTEPRD